VVLLLHGMPDDSSCWKYQVPTPLDAGFRVVVPDTLGYGRSDKPQELEPYVAGTLVEHLFELIERLELKDIRLVAHDWGAALGWAMVLEQPDLFRRFVSLSVGHLRCFVGQAFDEPARAIQAVKANWFMYLKTQAHARFIVT
jgi:pimeloyl-ACP methyl ester carboxylesterase